MKIITTTLSIFTLSLFLGFFPVSAQVDRCDQEINNQNYAACCTGLNYGQYQNDCDMYASSRQCDNITSQGQYTSCCSGAGAIINEAICRDKAGQFGAGGGGGAPTGGGSPNTNPVSGGSFGDGWGGANDSSQNPGSGAYSLSECSKITFTSVLDILIWLRCIIGAAIIPLLFALAFLFFLWGMVGYIRDANNEKKREESKKFIYWGVLGLIVMMSVWGIVRIVTRTFGIENTVPQLQTDCLKDPGPNNPCKTKK